MKIAIQGHPTRGKEIIQILRSLGATSYGTYDTCSNPEWYWYINKNREITCGHKRSMCGYKLYTLEEFEEEFPFKIGDRVISATTNFIGTITKLKESGWYYVKHDSGSLICVFRQHLKHYKEMKEERNVTLTLDKAKEWYKKGGELKEIALQAYSEEELTKIELPKSWEEFCKQGNPIASWRYNIPTKYEALHKLELLRDCYRGLFITVIGMPVWCITRYKRKLIVSTRIWGTNETFLSFQSLKVAEEYLNNFKPLIKQVEDLI